MDMKFCRFVSLSVSSIRDIRILIWNLGLEDVLEWMCSEKFGVLIGILDEPFDFVPQFFTNQHFLILFSLVL